MCGIAALLLYPKKRDTRTWNEIREIFTRNLEFNEARGEMATGLAVMRADGQFQVFKQPVRATEFVKLPEYHRLLKNLDSQTTLLLGHTRFPTKGQPENNRNNHPLIVGHTLGVHNGHIDNDDALFHQYHYPRQAQVDSEIIFRMLDSISSSKMNEEYLDSACQHLRLLRGQFTFLSADTRTPQHLLVLKHHNPLCIHYHADWDALVFSSRYIFLRKAFGRAVITEALPHDQVLLFDALALPQLRNQPQRTCLLNPQAK